MKMSKVCKDCEAEFYCKYKKVQCNFIKEKHDSKEVLSAVAEKLLKECILE